jgi:two-component system cell cycle response regulator CtrA
MHILVVEDGPIVADVLGMTLKETGYFKTTADTVESALFEFKHNQIDAVSLDLNLPDGDGTRLARLIRKNHMPVPILVVSGNSGINDKITALGAGADGYLTKPFDRYELVANLDAIIRRMHVHSSATVNVGNLMVDLSRNFAKIGYARLDLTAKGSRIIELLALRKGAVLSKDTFLNHLYGGIDEPGSKNIDVFMYKLRRKLADAGASGVVVDTIWEQGYILREMRDYDAMTATA